MRETKGRGIDLALNSLTGDFLHATWRYIAKFGIIIELGLRDVIQGGRPDMDMFQGSRTYAAVDLVHLGQERTAVLGR